MVEQFSRRLVVGWISVPPGTPPVRVSLHLGRLQVASTFATPQETMSGSNSVLRGGSDQPTGTAESAELVHSWQLRNIPGPVDDRRNSGQEMRTFSFRVRDIWPFVKKTTRIRVKVNDHPLPIYGHGMFLLPTRNGKQSLKALEKKFEQGYLFSQIGKLQLSKQLDVAWQEQVIGLYHRVREILDEDFGYDLFLIGGTLLGAVREGGHLGHDIDFDAAYVSRETRGEAAGAELVQIGLRLVERGMDVQCMTTALHVFDPKDPTSRIDIFHTFFDHDDLFAFPWGIAGTSVVPKSDWNGTRKIDFPGGWALVPDNAEQMVEHLYGDDWRLPKPGFNWNLDRTNSAPDGRLSAGQRSTVHWASFYAHHQFSEPSQLARVVDAADETPEHIVDIGCGDGRDARLFATHRDVLAVDWSPTAIDLARRLARQDGVEDRIRFEVCDVGDSDAFARLLREHQEAVQGPVMYYMRFLMHSLTPAVQGKLMDTIRGCTRPGDLVAVEFRTLQDEKRPKHYRKHYCRFVDPAEIEDVLRDDGFSVLSSVESDGLSPHEGEDPVLYRAILRR